MYAVIETGGKQYRVEVGTELEVELLDVEPGNTITLDRVLLVADGDDASIGQPLVANAAVSAEVLRQARGDKVIAFKYRPKARRRVKHGHRQDLTVLRISDITLGAKSAAKTEKKASDEARTERARLEEAAARAGCRRRRARGQAGRSNEDGRARRPRRSRSAVARRLPRLRPSPSTEATETKPDTAETTAEATETKPKRTRAKASGTDAAPAADGRGKAEAHPHHEEGRVAAWPTRRLAPARRTAATASASDSA